jgi:hypothetical protein
MSRRYRHVRLHPKARPEVRQCGGSSRNDRLSESGCDYGLEDSHGGPAIPNAKTIVAKGDRALRTVEKPDARPVSPFRVKTICAASEIISKDRYRYNGLIIAY